MTLVRVTTNDDENLREQCPRCSFWDLHESQIYDSALSVEVAGWNCHNCKAQFKGSP